MAKFRFFKWCRDAVSRIVLPEDRVSVEVELMDHLQDRYDYYKKLGYSEEDAEILSLNSMGNSDEIARELGLIHRPFWGRTVRITRILLIAAFFLTIFFGWCSLMENFYADPAFSSPVYEFYDPYSGEEANYQTGWGYRQFYATPDVSFSSDGYTATVTQAALWRNELRNASGVAEKTYPLYLQLTVTNPWIWSEADTFCPWIRAADSAGNQYASPYESAPGTNRILFKSYRANPWTSVHELVIWDLGSPDAQWIDLHYTRSGRNLTVRIDLTGGDTP